MQYTIAITVTVGASADPSAVLDAAIEALPDLVGHLEAVCIEAEVDDGDVCVTEVAS
jgi:hypothetical protein